MEAYFARQPILDVDLQLHGYELLFRPNPTAETSGDSVRLDGDRATASVLDAVSAHGIDKVTSGRRAYVNFTERLLLDKVATLYPKEYLTVEVLEDIPPTPEVVEALTNLKQLGYTIALDDYVYKPGDEPLLALADIIKIEVDKEWESFNNLKDLVYRVDLKKTLLLAERVETQEVFERFRRLGCSLFQGYFFAKPKLVVEQMVSPLRINHLRLMREAANRDINFVAVSNIVKQDVGLSYKILKLVNSAYFGRPNEVKNIHQAVVILGSDELKKWISFVTMTTMCADKPSELSRLSLTRGHMCEQIAIALKKERHSEAFFLGGLFSLLDSMMDLRMEDAIKDVSLPKITRDALMGEDNMVGRCLEMVQALEQGDWEKVTEKSLQLELPFEQVSELYFDTLTWVGTLADELLR